LKSVIFHFDLILVLGYTYASKAIARHYGKHYMV